MIENLVEKIDNLEKIVEKLVERVIFLKKVYFLCKISTIVKFFKHLILGKNSTIVKLTIVKLDCKCVS